MGDEILSIHRGRSWNFKKGEAVAIFSSKWVVQPLTRDNLHWTPKGLYLINGMDNGLDWKMDYRLEDGMEHSVEQ